MYKRQIQGVVADGLSGVGVADWLVSLVSDGIIGGLGAVLGFEMCIRDRALRQHKPS